MSAPTTFFLASGSRISLVRETPSWRPFAKPSHSVLPFEQWLAARPPEATAALAHILQALEDGVRAPDGAALVTADQDSATLHPAFVARLTDNEAQAIGLPAATRLVLNLRATGLLQRDGFRIETSWTRHGGVPVRATPRDGWLTGEGGEQRIPEPLFSTLAAVDAVNAAPDTAARYDAMARLKQAMGDEAAAAISPDGTIDRLRLAYASGFSLAINASAGGFDFDPVLFGRERMERAAEGTTLDEAEDSLLPPALAQGFTRHFRGGDGTRNSYLLNDGSILYVDPDLSRALGVVRTAQAGTAEQRRTFATAPQRHIAEALGIDPGEGSEGGHATGLFVETQQFSERVAGIDVWRKPVLPWIKPKPNSWLPEKFGLRIGDPPNARTIEISPEIIYEVAETARKALHENAATLHIEGEAEPVPVTQATVRALEDLAELLRAAEAVPDEVGPDAEPPPIARERYFLQVRDNLEELAFAPLVEAVAEAGPPSPPAEMPPELRSPPKPHQVIGFRWLAACWDARLPGALLADDMGLGKTYQALAFLTWIRRQQAGHPRPVLIVAPTGLLANWRAEIERHLEPDALGRVVGAYGRELALLRGGAGRDIDSGASAIDPAAWGQAGVVLTTYETMRDYHLSFARQPFAAILYDEAQKLKNPASQITRSAKTLNARFQLALTGTPVENRLQDLWSLFDVVHPGLLGTSKAFEETYNGSDEALRALNDLLTLSRGARPPVLLRRLKEECLGSLPAKHIRTLPVPMPRKQAEAYDRVVTRALAVKGTGQRGRMLEVLHLLRGVSLHPTAPEQANGDAGYFTDSARLATLFSLLAEIAGKGEKALIFCESLAMQALLAIEIRTRFGLDHPVARINGGVSGEARQGAVDAFQRRPAGFDAMILSPKAGGVGLTLTAANHVIHLSRWWNPAVEDQATDRAYRIGQMRDVTVYLPQSIHPDPAIGPVSFDLKLHDLMERKRKLSRGLFAPADDQSDADALFDSVVAGEGLGQPDMPIATAEGVVDEGSPVIDAPEFDSDPSLPPEAAAAVTPLADASAAPEPLSAVSPPELISTVKTPVANRTLRVLPGFIARPVPDARATAPSSPPSSPAISSVSEAGAVPKRIVYEPEKPRDLTIFLAPLANDPPREIRISDPYAAAGHRGRAAVVDFVAMLMQGSRAPERTVLITLDGESIERPAESSAHQYDQMQARWKNRFGASANLSHQQRSKRQSADFHDRDVQVITRSGKHYLWDLGRGVDGVMGTRFRCVINFHEM